MSEATRIRLSFRLEDVGGEVKRNPSIEPRQAESTLRAAQHVVLLIHGYNNDLKAALEAFDGFHARQKDTDGDARYGVGRVFVEVCWPGDAAWGGVSAMFYMWSIRRAQESADALADYLLALYPVGNVRIDLVAHSMGCRLSLELLKALDAKAAQLDVGRMLLMAGAVPVKLLADTQPAQRLRPAYDRVLREGVRSLYSGSDMILAWAFPAGQSFAPGDEGLMPTALGHEFWVESSVPLNLGQVENPSAGHSDYWGWNTQPQALHCAQKAAQEIREFLQFPSAGSRSVSARPLQESSAMEAREIAEQRFIQARDMENYWPEF